MLRHRLAVLLLLFSWAPLWANLNDAINQYKVTEGNQLRQSHQAVKTIDHWSAETLQHNIALVNHFLYGARKTLPSHRGGRAANGAILFVSFSMPSTLLREMAAQAHAYHIPVMIRGLVGNSMPKTLQAILTLKMQAKRIHQAFDGIGIDPVWFRQFGIDRVPALVVTKRPPGCIAEKMCPDQPFDVIYGNQAISDSLKEIVRDGSPAIAPIAKGLLASGRRVS